MNTHSFFADPDQDSDPYPALQNCGVTLNLCVFLSRNMRILIGNMNTIGMWVYYSIPICGCWLTVL